MAIHHLEEKLKSTDWPENVRLFLEREEIVQEIDISCRRLAIWSRQIENIEKKNAAISFIRAMQLSTHNSITTISLGIYKAAASSIREIVESALYYSYFRSHPTELATLVREASYYTSKSEILTYHKLHTPEFKELQEKIGLISRMDSWYSQISAIVHGQIPGIWIDGKSSKKIEHNPETLQSVTNSLVDSIKIVHDLFLITIGRELWDSFSHPAKKELTSGMSGELKLIIGLDKH